MLEANPTRGTKRPQHLRFIRQLPCVVCGYQPSEAAHVRMNRPEHGRLQALGQKPDDKWVLPLCAGCHRENPTAQHQIGEEAFWRRHGVDPHRLAAMLFAVSGDHEQAERIVRQASRLAAWE